MLTVVRGEIPLRWKGGETRRQNRKEREIEESTLSIGGERVFSLK